jgi:hypothetical protein
MPVCPQCDVAYLSGERHECVSGRSVFWRLVLAAGGVVLLVIAAGAAQWCRSDLSKVDGRYMLAAVLAAIALGCAAAGLGLIGAAVVTRRSKT